MNAMAYKGFSDRIEFDGADGIFFGIIAGIRDRISFHGTTVKDLNDAFHEAVDDYIETCVKTGKKPQKPYSKELMLRVSPGTHANGALAAELADKNITKWVEDELDKASSPN